MLLKICLERMLAECVPPAKHKEMREVITKSLEECQKSSSSTTNSNNNNNNASSSPATNINGTLSNAAFYWFPFKLAFQGISGGGGTSPKIKEVALDSIQKLVSFRLFSGRTVGILEYEDENLPPTPLDEKQVSPSAPYGSAAATNSSNHNLAPNNQRGSLPASRNYYSFIVGGNNNNASSGAPAAVQFSLIDEIVNTISECFHNEGMNSPNLFIPIIRALLTIFVTCEIHGYAMMKAVEVVYKIFLISAGTNGGVIVQTTAKAALTQMVTSMFGRLERKRLVLEKRSRSGASTMAASPIATHAMTSSSSLSPNEGLDEAFKTCKDDCRVLFRYLCQVTSKPELDLAISLTVAVQSRILSYELLLSALNQAGQVIKVDPVFLNLIKKELFLSLSKTGVSTNPSLFELTLSVFLMLLNLFHSQIKTEVEVLFNEIYLKILESPNATFAQKNKVLQSIQKISGNPQYLVDIYVNYDCDLAMESIYERIVVDLCKLAQGRKTMMMQSQTGSPNSPKAASEEGKEAKEGLLGFGQVASPEQIPILEGRLRLKSLKSLMSILSSLYRWCTESAPVLKANMGNVSNSVSPSSNPDEQNNGTDANNSNAPSNASGSPLLSPSNSSTYQPIIMPKSPLNFVTMNSHGAEKPSTPKQGSRTQVIMAPAPTGPNTSDASSAVGSPNMMDPARLEETKIKKRFLKEGIALFNSKPKHGIRFLVEKQLVENSPAAISEFIEQNLNSLNKVSLGEYFGESDEMGIKVMHAFVDRLDFRGMAFVSALRSFLQNFRLPGEAQKIDRIMEKFAARYFESNDSKNGNANSKTTGVFANADATYTLAFSVIMLNTDQHSPSIKKRMEKHEFIRNNRGINDNADLPDDFLGQIFDEIRANEIIFEDERLGMINNIKGKKSSSNALSSGIGEDIYERETAQMKAKSEARFKGPRPVAAAFRSAVHIEHVRSMFELVWGQLLAAISQMYAETSSGSDDAPVPESSTLTTTNANGTVTNSEEQFEVFQSCLEGFVFAIKIACMFNLETPRDAFVSTLAMFTHLLQGGRLNSPVATDPSESAPPAVEYSLPVFNLEKISGRKSMGALKALIHIAKVNGNDLGPNWFLVLQCISKVDANSSSSEFGRTPGSGSNGKSFSGAFSNFFSNYLSNANEGNGGNLSSNGTNSLSTDFMGTLTANNGAVSGGSSGVLSAASKRERRKRETLIFQELQSQETLLAVDFIFSNSVNLSGGAIIYFFKGLCQVSDQEMEHISHTNNNNNTGSSNNNNSSSSGSLRLFCLQRIVEVAYYNMSRIRLEWTQIWKVIAPHFNTAGSHGNHLIASYAIDALRQLSLKLLEREELANFHTQNDFLKSFEYIMKNQGEATLRQLVIDSLSMLILKRGEFLKSGWKSIFVVLGRAASDQSVPVLELAFTWLKTISTSYVHCIESNNFVDFVQCLVEFASVNEKKSEIAIEAVKLLDVTSERLFNEDSKDLGDVKSSEEEQPKSNEIQNSDDNFREMDVEKFYLNWFPILSGYSKIITDSVFDQCQRLALDGMTSSLQNIAYSLNGDYWKTLYRSVILPIVEDLKEESTSANNKIMNNNEDNNNGNNGNGNNGNNGEYQIVEGNKSLSSGKSAILRKCLAMLINLFSVKKNASSASPITRKERERNLQLLVNSDLFEGVLDLIYLMIASRNETFGPSCVTYAGQFINNCRDACRESPQWEIIVKYLGKIQSFCKQQKVFEPIIIAAGTSTGNSPFNSPTGSGTSSSSSPRNRIFADDDGEEGGDKKKEEIIQVIPAAVDNNNINSSTERLIIYQSQIHLNFIDLLRDLMVTSLPTNQQSITESENTTNNISNNNSNNTSCPLPPSVQLAMTGLLRDSLHYFRSINGQAGVARRLLLALGIKLEVDKVFYLKHEIKCCCVMLEVMFHSYKVIISSSTNSNNGELDSDGDSETMVKVDEEILKPLLDDCFHLLKRFLKWYKESQKQKRRSSGNGGGSGNGSGTSASVILASSLISQWSPIVVLIYRNISDIPWYNNTTSSSSSSSTNANNNTTSNGSTPLSPNSSTIRICRPALIQGGELRRQLPEFFRIAVELVTIDGIPELCNQLQRFMKKVGNHFLIENDIENESSKDGGEGEEQAVVEK